MIPTKARIGDYGYEENGWIATCVCVCVCEREKERAKERGRREREGMRENTRLTIAQCDLAVVSFMSHTNTNLMHELQNINIAGAAAKVAMHYLVNSCLHKK